jgi:cell division protein FtsA
MATTRSGLIAGLDVGTSKVCCFIARVDNGRLRCIGIGHHASKGVRAGAIVDMEDAEASIRAAVEAAERMAGETIREAFVSFTAGQPGSQLVSVEVALAGHEIGETDVAHVLDQGRRAEQPSDRQIVHSIPVGYSVDGARGVRDPRGMYGERLGVNIHLVTAATGPLRNLVSCVGRGHLAVAGLVAAPFAAGLSSLVEDETDLGVTVVDMGGGTSSIAVFYDGALVHVDVIPLGGGHISNDIARGLATPIAQAERLKTLYGGAIAGAGDDTEMIDVPQVGEAEPASAHHVPRSVLTGIIRPRAEEILELVRDAIQRSGFERVAGRRVVLTGGASQLQGLRELAARMLDKQVRLCQPLKVAGLADAAGGPAFAVCAGLLTYALKERADEIAREDDDRLRAQGRIARLGRWLRANF